MPGEKVTAGKKIKNKRLRKGKVMKRMKLFKRVLAGMLSATVLLANAAVVSAAEGSVLEGEESTAEVSVTDMAAPVVEEGTPKAGADMGEEESSEMPELQESLKEDEKTTIGQPVRLVCQDKTADLSGMGFVFYPASAAEPMVIGPDGQTELFLNEEGVLETEPLPCGTYTVHNMTEAQGQMPVEDFDVQILEDAPDTPQDWTILSDVADDVRVRIYKMDSETGKIVMLTGAKFKILNKDTGEYVSQSPYFDKDQYEFEMTQRGELLLPLGLPRGEYQAQETQAPEGYSLNTQGVEFSIQDGGSFETRPDGSKILNVSFPDTPITGELHIKKTGETLKAFTDNRFVYDTTRPLAGAVYEVHASEDIYTADFQVESNGSRVTKYKAGDKVGEYTTNADGEIIVPGLLPGTYKATEIKAPEGYAADQTEKTVTFASQGQDIPVVKEEIAFENTLRRAEVTVVKKEEGADKYIEGAVFALYSKDDIKISDGTIILGKDSKIEEKETGEDGKLTFEADIPAGYSYYIKEITPAPGYTSNNEVKEFTFTYAGVPEGNENIPYEFTFTNKPMEFLVSVVVKGSEEMLPGASMAIKDADGNVVDQWTSSGSPYKTQKLIPGKEYVLTELSPAPGYVTAADVAFTVRDTTEAQAVEMENEVTKLESC